MPLLADAELLGNGDALSRALDHNVGRFLTRAEVFSALNRSKSAGTLKIRGELHSEDLQVDPAVRITVPDPRLQLLRASTDPRTGCTWFRFRATAEPKLLPFYTTVCTPETVADTGATPKQAGNFAVITAADSKPAMPVLVQPSKSAGLAVRTSVSQMTLLVHPLQRGRLGKIIRVRVDGSGKFQKRGSWDRRRSIRPTREKLCISNQLAQRTPQPSQYCFY